MKKIDWVSFEVEYAQIKRVESAIEEANALLRENEIISTRLEARLAKMIKEMEETVASWQ